MKYILSIIVTAGAYLLVPVIVCFSGKKLKASTLKRINIFNCVVVWLTFSIIRINAGIEGSSAAVFLWGTVGHWLLKANCMKEGAQEELDSVKATAMSQNSNAPAPKGYDIKYSLSDPNEAPSPRRPGGLYFTSEELLYDPSIAAENNYQSKHEPTSIQSVPRPAPPNASTVVCRKCRKSFEATFAYCPHCGKKVSSHKKRKPLFIIATITLVCVVILAAYFVYSIIIAKENAFDAIRNQEFSKAKAYMDMIPNAEEKYPTEIEYIEAGKLMEEGKYLDALKAFNNLNYPVPASLMNQLRDNVYNVGVGYYRGKDYGFAKRYFSELGTHKRSDDYLTLIAAHQSSKSSNYANVAKLIGFEDAEDMLLSKKYIGAFLMGTWRTSNRSHYFTMDEEESVSYNLPVSVYSGTYTISSKGVYTLSNDWTDPTDCFKFNIVDKDTVDIYCYKDKKTYRMYRE